MGPYGYLRLLVIAMLGGYPSAFVVPRASGRPARRVPDPRTSLRPHGRAFFVADPAAISTTCATTQRNRHASIAKTRSRDLSVSRGAIPRSSNSSKGRVIIMSSIRNNAVLVATCNQRINALKAHVSAKTEIPLNGVTHKASDVIGIYQSVLDTQAALAKSRAQVDVDLAAHRDAEASRVAIEFPLKNWVLNTLGADSNAAREIGYSAPKKAKKSPEVVVSAVKLAKATRVARGTMGKKQKSKIKGSLAPTVPADPVATAAPVAAATVVTPAVGVAATGGAAPVGGATK